MRADRTEPSTGDVASSASPDAPDVAWVRVSDRLLRGLVHDLSGHVAVLSSLAGILGLEDEPRDTPGGLLAGEIERLEGMLTELRTYPADRGEAAEAVSMAETIPALLRLHARGDAGEGAAITLRLEPGLPAARLALTPFARALLLLLRRAGDAALVLGRVEVQLEVRAEGDDILVRVAAEGSAAAGDAGLLAAAAAYARQAGGRLVPPAATPDGVEIRLPALRAQLDAPGR